MRACELIVGGVAAECGHRGDPAFFRYPVDLEAIAAYVVLSEHVYAELAFLRDFLFKPHDVLEYAVVGYVVARRLAYSLVALATESEDVDPELLFHLLCHIVDVVADQPDRAGRKDADGLGLEDVVCLLDCGPELLFAPEYDVLVLEVGRKAVGHEIGVFGGRRPGLISPGKPTVESTPDRAMSQVYEIPGRPQHHAFAACITASALGYYAWERRGC